MECLIEWLALLYTLYRSWLLRITNNKQIDAFKCFLNELSWRSMILKQRESMRGLIAHSLNLLKLRKCFGVDVHFKSSWSLVTQLACWTDRGHLMVQLCNRLCILLFTISISYFSCLYDLCCWKHVTNKRTKKKIVIARQILRGRVLNQES